MEHASMSRNLRFFAFVLIAAVVIGAPAGAQQVWFAPPDNLDRGGLRVSAPDFFRLFDPGSDWPRALSRLNVFTLNNYYVSKASDAELTRIARFLAQHDVQLGAVTGVTIVDPHCGHHVEGLNYGPRVPGTHLRRFKKLGTDLHWVVMDAAMNAHDWQGRDACNYSVEDNVKGMVAAISGLREAYPNAKFAIIQSSNRFGLSLPEWKSELREELADYRKFVGVPLDALVFGTRFRLPNWVEFSQASIEICHEYGTQAGIILAAPGGRDVTDASWMAEARASAHAIVAAKLNFDIVMVASWMRHPEHDLPESDPMSLTALLNYYDDIVGKRQR
jgi:hypothetical protein